MAVEAQSGPLSTEDVLREEAKAIHGVDLTGKTGAELYRELNKLGRTALCMSGGGIRSASFALGVIQALAVHPRSPAGAPVASAEDSLLAKFHYLSTVSGGGYIGSWLSAWVTRAGFPNVWPHLVGRSRGPDVEPPTISWLRAYSNYLTPKLGIMSADFWAALALILRNLALTWLVILPVLCAGLLLLKLFAVLIGWIATFDPQSDDSWFYLAAGASIIVLFTTLVVTTLNRPTRGRCRFNQKQFLWFDLLPATLCGILATCDFAFPDIGDVYLLPKFSWTEASQFGSAMIAGAAIYAVAWIAGIPRWRGLLDSLGDLLAWMIAGGVYGASIAFGLYLYGLVYGPGIWEFAPSEVLLVVFGVPWMLTSQLAAEMIFVALTSYEKDSDADREWFGRAAGWYMATAIGWMVLMLLVFIASTVAVALYNDLRAWIATFGAGGIAAWFGNSRLTPARGKAKGATQVSMTLMVSIAAAIFAILLIVMGSSVLDTFVFGQSLIDTAGFGGNVEFEGYPDWPAGWSLPIALAISIAVATLASFYVNINRFSLHAMYRNRLIRAFLGASHGQKRKPNPFTDFDDADSLPVSELWPPKALWQQLQATGWQPFHIVNTALNVVSTKRLAWQERKAESFTVSPLHSGTAGGALDREPNGLWHARGAYRPSECYGGVGGITLGTALAISGAAASPNMGYNSSPALAFLLTLFNVRLGWWLGNPSASNAKIYGSSGPRWAIVPLISEMFGLTDDNSNYVYLSDGGHFENLGLYEMVRRRCQCIVVSDAGCDESYSFEDLGNAVRKISIDLGVTVTFERLAELKRRPLDGSDLGLGTPYYAVGEIDYPRADGSNEKGYILYLKAGYHGIESADIRAYALAHRSFPHESTGDQFFSKSQFESYRALGFETTSRVLREASDHLPDVHQSTICNLIKALKTET